MKLLSVLALAVLALPVAHASELDNENQVKNAQRFAADLPQTVVVREDASGNVAVLHSAEKLTAEAQIDESKFVPVKKAGKELDADSSKSGWYFYWYSYNYSYYPAYYYSGYNYYYQPYYNYSYNNYTYYYYRWNYRWSWGW